MLHDLVSRIARCGLGEPLTCFSLLMIFPGQISQVAIRLVVSRIVGNGLPERFPGFVWGILQTVVHAERRLGRGVLPGQERWFLGCYLIGIEGLVLFTLGVEDVALQEVGQAMTRVTGERLVQHLLGFVVQTCFEIDRRQTIVAQSQGIVRQGRECPESCSGSTGIAVMQIVICLLIFLQEGWRKCDGCNRPLTESRLHLLCP